MGACSVVVDLTGAEIGLDREIRSTPVFVISTSCPICWQENGNMLVSVVAGCLKMSSSRFKLAGSADTAIPVSSALVLST